MLGAQLYDRLHHVPALQHHVSTQTDGYQLFRTLAMLAGLPKLEDNRAGIAMVNENKPTQRARHVDIQWFAILEWRKRREIVLRYLPGIIHIADQATKPLSWILLSRHVRRAMGHHNPRST